MKRRLFSVILMTSLLLSQVQATVIYVSPSNNSGTGTSWASPTTLSSAVLNATSGDTIWVQIGLYRFVHLFISQDLYIFGGFAGWEVQLSDRVISVANMHDSIDASVLQGDHNVNASIFEINMPGHCEIDGFILEGAGLPGVTQGAGINSYGYGSLELNIRHVIFRGNKGLSGGGAYLHRTRANISQSVFYDNEVMDCGGGLFLSICNNTELVNVLFYKNRTNGSYLSTNRGGAIYVETTQAIFNHITTDQNMVQPTLTGVHADTSQLEIYNSIINDKVELDINSIVNYEYCYLFGPSNLLGGSVANYAVNMFYGNASGEFVSPPIDYHLTPASICIDAGNPVNGTIVPIDIEGTPRPQGNAEDIGAYECY